MVKRLLRQSSKRDGLGTQRAVIDIEPGSEVWPHELKTAEVLVSYGYNIRFLKKAEEKYCTSPDILINGTEWEMKSPKSSNIKRVQKTLRQALKQSQNIIYDSQRVKSLTDGQIEKELTRLCGYLKRINRLWFVNKKRELHIIK